MTSSSLPNTTASKPDRLQPLAQRISARTEDGGAFVISLIAVGTLAMIGATVMQMCGARLAAVAQASSWQKAYYLAESGVDIARNALRASSEDATIWATQKFPKSDGTSTGWDNTSPATFPKTATITMPGVADDGGLVNTINVVIDSPTGAGTINPSGSVTGRCYRVRSLGSTEVAGPVRNSHDSVETNLRKINWINNWRSGTSTTLTAGGANAARMIEVVLRPVSPFAAAVIAKEKIEIKKGSGKLIDSWNSKDPDSSQRKYLAPGSDKWKGARDVGNLAANGLNSKNKPIKDAIRLEGAVVWGDVYVGDAKQVNIKPTPATLTDVIKGGDIIDGFFMKLDPVAPQSTIASWLSGTTVTSAKPGTLATPMMLTASSDPSAPAQYKFTELHLHSTDAIIVKPATDVSGVVAATSYVNIWVANSLRIHKGGKVMLGNGVVANIYVDKCIHIESASKLGGITYADFDINGAGKLVSDSSGKPKYTEVQPTAAQDKLLANASQLMIYGALAKKKRSHAKISAELVGGIYAPNHDFKIKFKDPTYNNLYGSYVGRKFKIEGKTRIHYDENMSGQGIASDYQIASIVEDWYDRSSK